MEIEMKIGVLGAGRMAEGLVPLWLAAGHEVMIGGRTPARARELADRVGARAGTLREAAEFGEVVFLAVLRAGVESTLRGAGSDDGTLRDKVLIECTNAIEHEHFATTTTPGASVSNEIATATGAKVAKAFNQVHYDVWRRRAHYAGQPLVVPLAGHPEAKDVVRALVRDAGGEPLDAGGLENTHDLEAMAAVMIRLLFDGADPLAAFQFTVGCAGLSGSGDGANSTPADGRDRRQPGDRGRDGTGAGTGRR
jgi:predicted dinucleotide-binding enzyme